MMGNGGMAAWTGREGQAPGDEAVGAAPKPGRSFAGAADRDAAPDLRALFHDIVRCSVTLRRAQRARDVWAHEHPGEASPEVRAAVHEAHLAWCRAIDALEHLSRPGR